ncbi:MAG: phosphoribosylanthranilate isomerase [Nitrospinota bacterium]
MIKVKICGQTSIEDSDTSLALGADFIGVIYEVESSPRSLKLESASKIISTYPDQTFLLLCNHILDQEMIDIIKLLNPYAIELAGREDTAYLAKLHKHYKKKIFKSIHLPSSSLDIESDLQNYNLAIQSFLKVGCDGFMLDSKVANLYGGTGIQNDWRLASKIIATNQNIPIFLAGGINPANINSALNINSLYGVDIASGSEGETKGKKSVKKLRSIFEAIRNNNQLVDN